MSTKIHKYIAIPYSWVERNKRDVTFSQTSPKLQNTYFKLIRGFYKKNDNQMIKYI